MKGSTNAPAHFQSSAVVVRSVANDAGSSNAFGGWGAPPWGNANLCTCVTLQLLVVERQSKLFQTRLIRSFLLRPTALLAHKNPRHNGPFLPGFSCVPGKKYVIFTQDSGEISLQN